MKIKKQNRKFSKAYIKKEKILKFGDIEIQKHKFHEHKGLISIKNIDINQIVVSNNVLKVLVKKVLNILIGYKDAKKIKTLCILFPKERIRKRI